MEDCAPLDVAGALELVAIPGLPLSEPGGAMLETGGTLEALPDGEGPPLDVGTRVLDPAVTEEPEP